MNWKEILLKKFQMININYKYLFIGLMCTAIIISGVFSIFLLYENANRVKYLGKEIITVDDNQMFKCVLDKFDLKKDLLIIHGWIYKVDDDTFSPSVIILQSPTNCYVFKLDNQQRPDVTQSAHDGKNHDNSGFASIVNTKLLYDGKYMVIIGVANKDGSKKYYLTNKAIEVGGKSEKDY